jgi:hypothetical protein
MVIGPWSFVICHLLLVIGHWSLVLWIFEEFGQTNDKRQTTNDQ